MTRSNEGAVQILLIVLLVVVLASGFALLWGATYTATNKNSPLETSSGGENHYLKQLFSEGNRYYAVICLDGVEYHVLDAGSEGYMAVKYNPDGTISTC